LEKSGADSEFRSKNKKPYMLNAREYPFVSLWHYNIKTKIEN